VALAGGLVRWTEKEGGKLWENTQGQLTATSRTNISSNMVWSRVGSDGVTPAFLACRIWRRRTRSMAHRSMASSSSRPTSRLWNRPAAFCMARRISPLTVRRNLR
jgi:hypothetical protein